MSGAYEDSPLDQQWRLQSDGSIINPASGHCLLELGLKDAIRNISSSFDGPYEGDLSFPSLYGVTTTLDCVGSTKWDVEQFVGGKYISHLFL